MCFRIAKIVQTRIDGRCFFLLENMQKATYTCVYKAIYKKI